VTQNFSPLSSPLEVGYRDGMNQSSKSDNGTTALQDELANFHRFAEGKLHTPGYTSLEELLGLWRANHPVGKDSPDVRAGRAKASSSAKAEDPKRGAVPYL
jgi:hypothetical protein